MAKLQNGIDFESLTAEEVDALDGYKREAYYSFVNGDFDESDRILALYDEHGTSAPENIPPVVEVDADGEPVASEELSKREQAAAKRAAARQAKADAKAAEEQAAAVAAEAAAAVAALEQAEPVI